VAAQPYKLTDDAMKDYATFLREKVAGIAHDDKTTIIGTPVDAKPCWPSSLTR